MGTHCYIAKQVGPDQYRTIYCHLDGYLEEAGAHLAGHYDTEEQVDKLLDLGDIYYLQDKLDPDPSMAHYAPSRQKGVTFAYGRDMDDNRWPATIKSMEELEENNNWCEFLYIFKPHEGWEFLQYGQNNGLRNLKECLDQFGIQYRPEEQSEDAAPEQADNGEEETYEQKM